MAKNIMLKLSKSQTVLVIAIIEASVGLLGFLANYYLPVDVSLPVIGFVGTVSQAFIVYLTATSDPVKSYEHKEKIKNAVTN